MRVNLLNVIKWEHSSTDILFGIALGISTFEHFQIGDDIPMRGLFGLVLTARITRRTNASPLLPCSALWYLMTPGHPGNVS